MIYFIEATGAGLVKIGHTDGDPLVRLKRLQTGCPHVLRLRATLPGTAVREREIHQSFAHLRSGGEWFALGLELEVFIGMAQHIFPLLSAFEAKLSRLEEEGWEQSGELACDLKRFEDRLSAISSGH